MNQIAPQPELASPISEEEEYRALHEFLFHGMNGRAYERRLTQQLDLIQQQAQQAPHLVGSLQPVADKLLRLMMEGFLQESMYQSTTRLDLLVARCAKETSPSIEAPGAVNQIYARMHRYVALAVEDALAAGCERGRG